ncbi:MAG TPA: hypothetical protein VGI29_04510 [Candidatus Binataceae bacterium]
MKLPPLKPIKPIDPGRALTRPLARLSRKVERGQFARALSAGATMREFFSALPETLAAADLSELARRVAAARRAGRTFLMLTGAHPLKVGLSPIICGMLRDGVLSAIATNGAAIIHDFELAFAGRTSEDVGAGLADGSFGMAEETGAFLNRAARLAADEGRGLGETMGREIDRARLPYRDASIFVAAFRAGAPATVHVAVGADIVHMHPAADGAAIGKATMADFHRLVSLVATLGRGVVLNLGSAVVMPEVFLKALNLARNLGRRVEGFCAADMDFVRQYRARINVVERPTAGGKGARGIALTGHHEIMFPLLAAAIREELARPPRRRG